MTDPHIPPGKGMAVLPDRLETVRSPCGFSGVLVDSDGRLSLCLGGEGVRATFVEPERLLALAAVLQNAADQLLNQRATTANEVSAELERVLDDYARERKHDA